MDYYYTCIHCFEIPLNFITVLINSLNFIVFDGLPLNENLRASREGSRLFYGRGTPLSGTLTVDPNLTRSPLVVEISAWPMHDSRSPTSQPSVESDSRDGECP